MNSWGSSVRFEIPAELPPRVQALMDLGFQREQAVSALQRAGGSIQQAAADLLGGAPPTPPSVDAAGPTAGSAAGPALLPVAPARPAPHPTAPSAAPAPSPTVRAVGVADALDALEEAVIELVGMGFDDAEARAALAQSGGALQEAVQMLLDLPAGATLMQPPPPHQSPPEQPLRPVVMAVPVVIPAPVHNSVPDGSERGGMRSQEETPVADPLVQRFAEMGFSLPKIEAALVRTGRDRDRTMALLLDPEWSP